MKVGCMVWAIDGLDLDFWGQIAWIREHGFDEVSFHTCRHLAGTGQGIEPDCGDKTLLARLKGSLAGFTEVDIHAPFDNYDLCFVSPNPLVREASIRTLEKTIRFAAGIGAETVTFHPGTSGAAMAEKERKANLQESLFKLDEMAGDAGVKLAVEMEGDYTVLAEAGVRHIGLTLDTGHLSSEDGAGYRQYGTIGGIIRAFPDRVFHLHIHDYDGSHDHLALGKGRIDFREIVSSLKETGYQGSLCLELNENRNSVADWLESREFLKRLLAEIA